MSYKQLTDADQDDDMEQDPLMSDHEEDEDLEAGVPMENGGIAESFANSNLE